MRGVRVERPRMYSSKRKHQGIPVSALLYQPRRTQTEGARSVVRAVASSALVSAKREERSARSTRRQVEVHSVKRKRELTERRGRSSSSSVPVSGWFLLADMAYVAGREGPMRSSGLLDEVQAELRESRRQPLKHLDSIHLNQIKFIWVRVFAILSARPLPVLAPHRSRYARILPVPSAVDSMLTNRCSRQSPLCLNPRSRR